MTRPEAPILTVMASRDLDERVRKTCRDRGAAAAVLNLSDGRVVTFAELADQYARIRHALTEGGVQAGSSVVTLVGNRPAFLTAFAACMDVGAALVPLGEATAAEAASAVSRAGAVAVITDRPLPLDLSGETTVDKDVRILFLNDQVGRAAYGESVVLKLTSGSTDVPKAAVADIRHLINDGRHVIEAMAIRPDDVNLACIPLSHSYALGNVVMPLLLQGTTVALRPSFNPSQFVRDAEASAATVFPGVPFMFDRLRALDLDRLPARLRLLITAGARIEPATVNWFRQQLDRKVHSFYGSSETGGIAYDDNEDVADPLDVGRPMPETTVAIRDPDPAGVGRIFVAGTAVASGYADPDPSDSVSVFDEGGFMTSDLGCLNGQGRVVLTGRVSRLVNVAGRKVDPVEVERVLVQVPGVIDARVIGAACDQRGQQLVAFVVSKVALTPVAMRQRCADMLSPHKIPRQFIFLDRLPLDARGKTDRLALEALASSAVDA